MFILSRSHNILITELIKRAGTQTIKKTQNN